MNSRYFGGLALAGINKVGEAYCPGDDGFPSFKKLGVIEFIDQVAEDIPAGDRDGLKILFSIFGLMPQFLVTLIFACLERAWAKGIPIGTLGRQIRLGFRGIAFSLYYSGLKGKSFPGPTPLELIEFKLQVNR